MQIKLTSHAKQRLAMRGITLFDLRDALTSAKMELRDTPFVKLTTFLRLKKLIIIGKKQKNILTIITVFWR